jgi:YYY domain-containing protein
MSNIWLEIGYTFAWWLALEGVGLLVLPLTFRLFRHLPDRGYAFSRPLGLILVNYALWMLSTFGLLRNTWGNILLVMILALGVSVFLYRRRRAEGGPAADEATLRTWVSEHRNTVIATELVFTLAFVLWAVYKAYDPNIAVTEKPMEFAFLNAIMRSDRFPPYDPWMSGYSISYYYFGYVMVATLAKFARIPASYAFNLAIAMLFALTASGAFSVVYNMVYVVAAVRAAMRKAIYYGVIAAILIPLSGNLEGVLEFAHANGVGVTVDEPGNVSGPFWEWIDVKNLTRNGSLSSTWYPTDGWWWWRASRVIHDKGLTGNDMEVIDEFPAFSFLLGDMHPHVLAYPFVFMLIALAFNLLLSTVAPPEEMWWLVYLCMGAIGFLNSWDMPFYFFLLVVAYGLNRYLHPTLDSRSLLERALARLPRVSRALAFGPAWVRQVIYRALELGVVSVLLYLPYWLYSRPKAGTGILPNLFNVSRFAHLFVMFGAFFVVLAVLLALLLSDLWRKKAITARSLFRQGGGIWLGTMLFFPVLLTLVLIPVTLSPTIRTYIDDVLANPQVQQFLGPQTLGSLLRISLRIRLGLLPQQLKAIRLPAGPWTFLVVSLLVAGVVFWLVRTTFPRWFKSDASEIVPPLPSLHFAMLLAFTGLMLIFSVEFVYLRDAFGSRMNTVFKFYFQAWALLGLVATFGVYYVVDGYDPSGGRNGGRLGRALFGLVCALLLFAGLLYPLGASISRTGGFAGPPSLDGMAFVARDHPEEYAAIRWLNQNVPGNPVIVEAVRGSFAYEHARVSSRTGLPAVMGWTGHESQWHALHDEIAEREGDVNLLYKGSISDAKRIMAKYDVTYVFVGYLERAEFGDAVRKFGRFMDVAFQDGNTVIYKGK